MEYTATFPSENPEVNPLKIEVKGVDPKDQKIRFLSPEPGETLAAEDLAIAISLMFASDAVDKKRTHYLLRWRRCVKGSPVIG